MTGLDVRLPIATERLVLRAHRADDLDDLVAFHSDPEVVRHVPWPVRDREATAARYRWRVEPQVSAPLPFDDRAPGPPRWLLTLEKGSLMGRKGAPQGEHYLVDLTENGLVQADIQDRDYSHTAGVAPISRSASAALGDRLPQTG